MGYHTDTPRPNRKGYTPAGTTENQRPIGFSAKGYRPLDIGLSYWVKKILTEPVDCLYPNL